MSTWHQDQAAHRNYRAGRPMVLWHETKWTLVEDPPGGCMSLERIADEKEALEKMKLRPHSYVLRPAPWPAYMKPHAKTLSPAACP